MLNQVRGLRTNKWAGCEGQEEEEQKEEKEETCLLQTPLLLLLLLPLLLNRVFISLAVM